MSKTERVEFRLNSEDAAQMRVVAALDGGGNVSAALRRLIRERYQVLGRTGAIARHLMGDARTGEGEDIGDFRRWLTLGG